MTNTVKNLTLIGLILEGLFLIIGVILLIVLFQPDVVMAIENALGTESEFFPLLRGFLIFVVMVASGFFIFNLIVFTPITKGTVTSRTGTVLLYQAIYGAVLLSFNQVVGLTYLISGILGRNKHERDIENVREGL